MDKLKELFKQLGGSDELVNTLSEELVRYGEELKEQYDRDFKVRIQKARQICLEEVQKEKAALARKVSIFLESKLEAIEKAADKQRLQEDTEATNKLKHMRALLEGIALEDNGQSRELQESKKQLTRLTKAFKTLKEERNQAVRKANQANDIALKTLKRNRLLESKAKAGNVLAESKPATKKKVVAEKTSGGRKQSKKPLTEGRNVPAKSKTRRTPASAGGSGKNAVDTRIAGIAAQMETDNI
jgi:hypothetical protein